MSDGCQPRGWIVWKSFNVPFSGGGDECFLQRLFREIERARDTDQRGDNSSVLFAKDLFERLACLQHAGERYTVPACMQSVARDQADAGTAASTSGRTSIVPVCADGMRAAMLVASSRFSASIRKYPPSCSCVS